MTHQVCAYRCAARVPRRASNGKEVEEGGSESLVEEKERVTEEVRVTDWELDKKKSNEYNK